ncbi:MAG: redoxin domain-containing protein [bacterium]|nr:redoxin domain-containing protein [bacterium]
MKLNSKVVVVGAAVALPLLVVLAVSLRFDPRTIPSPLIGTQAPVFELEDLDGETVSLSDLRGQPVLINFWATWCQPCVVEHPVLVDGARRYQGRAKFLGIIYQDEREKIERFMRLRGNWGSTLVDPESKVALAYGVYGAPETFILDRNGKIVEKVTGAMGPRQLDALLGPLL